MATFNKFNAFVADAANKVHNLGADALKVMLTNTLPVAGNAVKSDITEIAAGNGYTAGGNAATLVSSSQTAGLYKLILNSPATWTATGGTMATFQYAVLYNSTPGSGPLIGWWAYPSPIVLLVGEPFNVTLDGGTGVIQIQ
jgi:hypothetical protein